MKEITFKEFVQKYPAPLWWNIMSNKKVSNFCREHDLIHEHLYFDNGFFRFDVYKKGEMLFSLYDMDPVRLMDTSLDVLEKWHFV